MIKEQAQEIVARCWCTDKTSCIPMDIRIADVFVETLMAEVNKAEEANEILRMQLAACGVGAQLNTPVLIKEKRVDRDSVYWSASLQDVYAAVDREIVNRERAEVLEAAHEEIKAAVFPGQACGVDQLYLQNISCEALLRVKTPVGV